MTMTAEEANNLKVGDRLWFQAGGPPLKGNIVEVNPAGRPDTFKVRWDNGIEGSYTRAQLRDKGTLLK
jgi:hypothetical protein